MYAGLLFLVATILLGSFLAVRLSYAAWSEPSVAPPGNNTNPPLDTSSTSQNKTGALTVGSTTNYTAVGMYAPIYYDANNTSYYLQPSNPSTSAVFAGNVAAGGATITGNTSILGTLDMNNDSITNLANPVNAQDAATKSYVDAASSGGSDASNSMTANSGMYENKIIAMNPPAAYTEICFKNGATYYDIHAAGAATGGGNCSVGDTGYIIEDAVRSTAYFTTAKQVCTENNMRLPEPYEWQLACMNASTWGLSSMGTQWEWASNFTLPMYYSSSIGVGAAVFGTSGCGYADWAWLGNNIGNQYSGNYRCAR